MDFEAIMPYAIFVAISFMVWALSSLFTEKKTNSRASERLDEMRSPRKPGVMENKNDGIKGMMEKAAPALSSALKPKTESEQNDLKLRMLNAGFRSQNAPNIYLAIKFVSLILGAIIGTSIGLPTYGTSQAGLTTIVIIAGFAFYLPEVVLWWIKSSRQQKIFLSLPDALDLLVVCVEAGLGLDQGIRRVTEELKDTHTEICSEFEYSNFQLQMGRLRKEVLHDLGVRTGVDDMRAFVAILIQAEKFGSSIAQALRVQSDSMRVKRMQMAEEKAAQTAVKILFPLVLFIFPGIFVVLVGPAAIMVIDGLLNK
jgi:tight adherence protein C